MIFIIAIVILVLIYMVVKSKGKKKPIEEQPIDETACDGLSDAELKILKVYCCGGVEIRSGETILVTNQDGEYEVRGFNLKKEKVCLNPKLVIWKSNCGCIKFQNETGLTNNIYCSIKGELQRSISIKYLGGVMFNWKIQFK